jgi:hypothetical protein
MIEPRKQPKPKSNLILPTAELRARKARKNIQRPLPPPKPHPAAQPHRVTPID